MMGESVCIIPIKRHSSRVPGKNFREILGKKLYQYLIENVLKADCFDAVYIDTDSTEIGEFVRNLRINIIQREPWLAGDDANGNDLLVHHRKLLPNFEYYFQLFITAPFLTPESIKECHKKLILCKDIDSIFTATKEKGWFWFNEQPVNFRPGILPRSQDAKCLIKETTGLYGISAYALDKYCCRIGAKLYIYFVKQFEAIDLDTKEDFIFAEYILKNRIL